MKDEEGTDPNIVTGSDSEKNIDDLKGKDLLKRLHEVGTLAQVILPFSNYSLQRFCLPSL